MSQVSLSGEPVSNISPSYPVVFPVNRSLVPGSDEAKKMTVTSGRKCLESCRSSGPLGCLERMLLESSIWNSRIVLLTWKAFTIPSGHSLFQLAVSKPGIEGIGCSSLLPTPDTYPEGSNKNCNRKYPKSLKQAAEDDYSPVMFPTPQAYSFAESHRPGLTRLDCKVRGLYPTPKSRDWKGQTQRGIHAPMDALPNMDGGEGKAIGGLLNPLWVEWLMGFPPEWTVLNALEMQSYLPKPTRSSKRSQISKKAV